MAVQQEILDQVNRLIDQSDGRTLDLSRFPYMGTETTQQVIRASAERLPNLTTLNLLDNQIGAAGARAIAERLTNLTTLHLGNNQIGDAGARAIAERWTSPGIVGAGGWVYPVS